MLRYFKLRAKLGLVLGGVVFSYSSHQSPNVGLVSLNTPYAYTFHPNTLKEITMPPPTPLIASPKLLALLESLHSASLEQESKLNWAQLRNEPQDAFDTLMRDKYISLDQDKCELVYHLLRGKGATTIVEAGTSFGVSTIYLALAAAQNASRDALGSIKKGRVIATEKEETKARVARSTWAKAGEEIAGVIDLRIGDLRETLTSGLDNVDFLLLDSKFRLFVLGYCGSLSHSPDLACRC